jgi:molybdopterin-guanine dinucleotide biosynthesis protein A
MNLQPPIAGMVLAGGQSRRMGREKSFVTLGGTPLIANAIARLRPQVDILAINANGDPQRFAAFGLPVIGDTVPGFAGPLAGILAGLEWAATAKAHWLATVSVDTPFFPTDMVARFAGAARPGEIAIARSGGEVHPVFGLFPVTAATSLAAFLTAPGTRRVKDWFATRRTVAVDFEALSPGDIDPFFNVNTPADLKRAGRILASLKLPKL